MEQKSFQTSKYGKLYLVPTPIGNLADITLRALSVLKEVDLIAAEDTRHSGILLQHFQIKKPLISLHEHNYAQRVPELIEKLKAGTTIAQISDAGMPSISDPGHELVLAAIKAGIDVISLPGPTAGMTALIASGLPAERFAFIGFLPKKSSEQQQLLSAWQNVDATLIFYESPYRIQKTLSAMQEQFSEQAQVVLARELTKKFESYFRGSLAQALDFVAENEPRGEFVILLHPVPQENTLSEASIKEAVQRRIDHGEKAIDAIKALAKASGLHRAQVYDIYHKEN
ncbi:MULTISPECIES: 16S rRNA (cytidine(1402)-2'-O)-methyltransferase [Oenococcus]|uniref:Ribosomal RNA small subunit methyltransferase I n=1 Tax=Oenococcus kitaharae DSM 17330 TaxID=1045004 RepID=G9WGP6_9LACO|nr:16S rRNA (cytidine(1402)-2'-O)-methyltransferase [Oenococcus kitaharae]EHN59873.1 rRNA small subunit methyltransferase I [Oenococcus kitaharae DSM 17330]OEY82065.1 16S rRNA methyltransferase [Oenococcus kitaharae]OEY82480.1 16S rRNA methyltransferase [Oenococcus kitaharae]OEY83778.1 16S rRNA methyltransferase [Oenococcus kitaharae]